MAPTRRHPFVSKFDEGLDEDLKKIKTIGEYDVKRQQEEKKTMLEIDFPAIMAQWVSYFERMPGAGARLSTDDLIRLQNSRIILKGFNVLLEHQWDDLLKEYGVVMKRRVRKKVFPPRLRAAADGAIQGPPKKKTRKTNGVPAVHPTVEPDPPIVLDETQGRAAHTLIEPSSAFNVEAARFRYSQLVEDFTNFQFGDGVRDLPPEDLNIQTAGDAALIADPDAIRLPSFIEDVGADKNAGQIPVTSEAVAEVDASRVQTTSDGALVTDVDSIRMPPPPPPAPQIVVCPPSSSTSEMAEEARKLLEQLDAQLGRPKEKQKAPKPPKTPKLKFYKRTLLTAAQSLKIKMNLLPDPEYRPDFLDVDWISPYDFSDSNPVLPGTFEVMKYKFQHVFDDRCQSDDAQVLDAVDKALADWDAKGLLKDPTILASIPRVSLRDGSAGSSIAGIAGVAPSPANSEEISGGIRVSAESGRLPEIGATSTPVAGLQNVRRFGQEVELEPLPDAPSEILADLVLQPVPSDIPSHSGPPIEPQSSGRDDDGVPLDGRSVRWRPSEIAASSTPSARRRSARQPSGAGRLPDQLELPAASFDAPPAATGEPLGIADPPVQPDAAIAASQLESSGSELVSTVTNSTLTIPENELVAETKIVAELTEIWTRNPSAIIRFSDLCPTHIASRDVAALTFKIIINLWGSGMFDITQDSPDPRNIYLKKT
ncbi:Hypothetical protein NTJ_10014 [Nesidiocoris tenuis]|uniref:Condensin-2 complex subunit H2 C-terminal domain-containing protein n=1 Tax=Nesidiocoris tenuis TaxID=355587 RepID=A0ABN7B211_9HEMI|nr:Hypothetical protein NTJ_10014 [Nesidiocoris tenuis]